MMTTSADKTSQKISERTALERMQRIYERWMKLRRSSLYASLPRLTWWRGLLVSTAFGLLRLSIILMRKALRGQSVQKLDYQLLILEEQLERQHGRSREHAFKAARSL
jgi:hypothetical protein